MFSIIISCKKFDSNDPLSIYSPKDGKINEQAKIKPAEISEWLEELPLPLAVKREKGQNNVSSKDGLEQLRNNLPFPVKWDKAQQRIMNGKHVIRVPVSKDACMIFIKEKENAPLSVYAYKWENEKPGKELFSGKVAWFSFQDYQMRGQKFDKGRGSNIVKFKAKEEINIVKVQAQKKDTNASTKSWFGDALRAIGNALGALGCMMTGGSWDNGTGGGWTDNTNGSWSESCSGQFWTWDWSFSSSSGSEGGGYGNEDGSLFLNINSSYDGYGGSEGGSGISTWTTFNADASGYISPVDVLSASLGGLTEYEKNWLNQHTNRLDEISKNVTYSTLAPAVRISTANAHLDKMIADYNYLTFVENYASNLSNTNMWWENEAWLADPNNVNLDIDFVNTQQYAGLNPSEIALVKRFPFDAQALFRNKIAAISKSENLFTDLHNGKGDAFRHAYFNAMNYRDCGTDQITGLNVAKLFSDAHETTTPADLQIEKDMDLFNNAVGHQVGSTATIFTLNYTLSDLVISKLNSGELKYLKPIDPSTGNIIPGMTQTYFTNQ